jgi:HEAT repeat protein
MAGAEVPCPDCGNPLGVPGPKPDAAGMSSPAPPAAAEDRAPTTPSRSEARYEALNRERIAELTEVARSEDSFRASQAIRELADKYGRHYRSAIEAIVVAYAATINREREHPSRYHIYSGMRDTVIEGLTKLGQVAVPPLVAALDSSRPEHERFCAMRALGEIGSTQAVEPLVALLCDDGKTVMAEEERSCATLALGKIGGTRALEALAALLNDADEAVRVRAAKGLCKLGDPRGASIVINLMREGDFYASKELLVGLGSQIMPEILAAWESNQELPRTASNRFGTLMGLSELMGASGDIRAVEPLLAAIRSTDCRQEAGYCARALERVKPENRTSEEEVWCLVGQLKWQEAVAYGQLAVRPLATALMNWDSPTSLDTDYRSDLPMALAAAGRGRALPVLIAATKRQLFLVPQVVQAVEKVLHECAGDADEADLQTVARWRSLKVQQYAPDDSEHGLITQEYGYDCSRASALARAELERRGIPIRRGGLWPTWKRDGKRSCATRGKAFPCPLCGREILVKTVREGRNTCPHCGRSYTARF